MILKNPFDDDKRISEEALKYFTDREDYIKTFLTYVNAPESQPLNVLVFCGVGGIGKTTLVRKLGQGLSEAKPPYPVPALPWARVDLETIASPAQAYRQALLRLRTDFGRDYHIDFPQFDLCLSLMLVHEGGSIPELVRVNPGLKGVYDFAIAASPIPFTGTVAAVGNQLIKEAAKHSKRLETWLRRAGGTEEVMALRERARHDDMTLFDELIKRFALDLRDGLKPRPGKACRAVLFIDSHERLWRGRETDRSDQARILDAWIRELAKFCLHSGVLPVISGRDHLQWDTLDPEWKGRIDQHLLGGLSATDAQVFLAKCQIGPDADEKASSLQKAIIDCCNEETDSKKEIRCHTFFLALCAEIALNLRSQQGFDPRPETFYGIPRGTEANELARRFLQSLNDGPMETWLTELSLTPRFNQDAALSLRTGLDSYTARENWESLVGFSFTTTETDGFQRLHETMRTALRFRVVEPDVARIHQHFYDYWTEHGNGPLAFYHRWSLTPADALNEWNSLLDAALKERRISDARALLDWWSDIPLDEEAQTTLGGDLWAETHFLLANAYANIPTVTAASALSTAIVHYEAALRVYTEADYPQQWAATQNDLGIAYSDLPTGNRGANTIEAIRHYEAALRVRTEADCPQDWAAAQYNLGNAYANIPTVTAASALSTAIVHYEAALRIYTEADYPQQWAMTQQNIGLVYVQSARASHRAEDVIASVEHFAAAERGFAAVGQKEKQAEATAQREYAKGFVRQIHEGRQDGQSKAKDD